MAAKRLCVFLLQVLCVSCSLRVALSANKLLLVLVDGMRWDYADRENLNSFKQLEKQGARATKLRPNYPSSSYPNYYSIMTGLHCENHGMISNFMYDAEHEEIFDIGANPESHHSYWWNDAEPLWIGAEQQGKRSFLLSWPSCNVTIRNLKPTYCSEWTSEPPQDGKSLKNDFRKAVEALKNNSADFVGVYYGMIDHLGHLYGPNGTELNSELKVLDGAIAELLKITADMRETLNIIVVADHGMTSIKTVVNLTERMDVDDLVNFPPNGSMSHAANTEIWPKINASDLVEKLNNVSAEEKHFTAYLKKDIPERFYYKNHRRVAPVVVMADLGYYITTFESPDIVTYNDSSGVMQKFKGDHGYDNTESDMHAIFYAIGPNFQVNSKVDLINNTDVYQIMCRILGIEAMANNGSWSAVESLTAFNQTSTTSSPTSSSTTASSPETTSSLTTTTIAAEPQNSGVNAGFVILGLAIAGVLVVAGVCIWRKYKKRDYDDLAFLRDDFSYSRTEFTDRDL